MLAYVFWHRPLESSETEAYEQAQVAFHRSLARTPPVGLHGSLAFRIGQLPWLAPAAEPASAVAAPEPAGAVSATGPASAVSAPEPAGAVYAAGSANPLAGYEDWYFVEDYTALGILNEAAVGRGHRGPHDNLARRFGRGAGGLYGLVEGERPTALTGDPRSTGAEVGLAAGAAEGVAAGTAGGLAAGMAAGVATGAVAVTVWVTRPPGAERRGLAELLGDGMDPQRASLWRRQLVFGPAPEFCLLASEPSAGVAPTRLPAGWSATVLEREVLWGG
jgi:hypothetical protein